MSDLLKLDGRIVVVSGAGGGGIGTVPGAVRGIDGDLYGLVNVAGGAEPATWMPSTRVSRDDWRALFTANLATAFFMSQAVAAEIRHNRNPGSIVSISSISGMNTAPFHIAYGTAKTAIVAMTRTMAVELAQQNIRVNAVAPGVTAPTRCSSTGWRPRAATTKRMAAVQEGTKSLASPAPCPTRTANAAPSICTRSWRSTRAPANRESFKENTDR